MERNELFERIRDHASGWTMTPRAVWVLGSAARGEGNITSDIDLLVLRPDGVDLAETELKAMVHRDDRLVRELRADAVSLHGTSLLDLLRQRSEGGGDAHVGDIHRSRS